jgi:predicted nucleic acid-binding protein
MVVFVDTSAFLSLFDEDDGHHASAVATWRRLLQERTTLCSTDYVRLETWSLLQARFGLEAVRTFDLAYLPVIEWCHVSEVQFAAAKTLVVTTRSRRLSLVDAASFTVMRDEAITAAFAYDRHFREHGFTVV